MMKSIKTAVLVGLTGLILMGSPGIAFAQGSVFVNGYLFVCENTCVVGPGPNGQLQVRDSGFGWVIMRRPSGPINVPESVSEPEQEA